VVTTTVTCYSWAPSSGDHLFACGAISRPPHRVANFPTSFSFYSCVTMDGNPAFTVHATTHAFRAARNLNIMLLRQHIWCLRKLLMDLMWKWTWCGS